jgi:hypothetical protein
MNHNDAKLKKVAGLVHSLEVELNVLESAHRIQFETTASLKDKLLAAKEARSALTNARRVCRDISNTLVEPD